MVEPGVIVRFPCYSKYGVRIFKYSCWGLFGMRFSSKTLTRHCTRQGTSVPRSRAETKEKHSNYSTLSIDCIGEVLAVAFVFSMVKIGPNKTRISS